MRFFLVLLALCLFAFNYAQSLDCYATDVNTLKAQESVIKNCEDFFLELTGEKYDVSRFLNYEDNLRCFIVDVESDEGAFSIQGCALRDSCGKITNEIMRQEPFVQDKFMYNMTCIECADDKCNARVNSETETKKFEKTKYLIFTVVMILIFMIVISVMLRAFSKQAYVAKKKYILIKA